jgi:hypothetical protein
LRNHLAGASENSTITVAEMKRRIKRIAPLQAGKMLGVLYACIGLIFLPLVALAALAGAFARQAQHGSAAPAAIAMGVMIGSAIMMPLIYGLIGFVFGLMGAAIYNLIASWIGGIEVEVE